MPIDKKIDLSGKMDEMGKDVSNEITSEIAKIIKSTPGAVSSRAKNGKVSADFEVEATAKINITSDVIINEPQLKKKIDEAKQRLEEANKEFEHYKSTHTDDAISYGQTLTIKEYGNRRRQILKDIEFLRQIQSKINSKDSIDKIMSTSKVNEKWKSNYEYGNKRTNIIPKFVDKLFSEVRGTTSGKFNYDKLEAEVESDVVTKLEQAGRYLVSRKGTEIINEQTKAIQIQTEELEKNTKAQKENKTEQQKPVNKKIINDLNDRIKSYKLANGKQKRDSLGFQIAKDMVANDVTPSDVKAFPAQLTEEYQKALERAGKAEQVQQEETKKTTKAVEEKKEAETKAVETVVEETKEVKKLSAEFEKLWNAYQKVGGNTKTQQNTRAGYLDKMAQEMIKNGYSLNDLDDERKGLLTGAYNKALYGVVDEDTKAKEENTRVTDENTKSIRENFNARKIDKLNDDIFLVNNISGSSKKKEELHESLSVFLDNEDQGLKELQADYNKLEQSISSFNTTVRKVSKDASMKSLEYGTEEYNQAVQNVSETILQMNKEGKEGTYEYIVELKKLLNLFEIYDKEIKASGGYADGRIDLSHKIISFARFYSGSEDHDYQNGAVLSAFADGVSNYMRDDSGKLLPLRDVIANTLGYTSVSNGFNDVFGLTEDLVVAEKLKAVIDYIGSNREAIITTTTQELQQESEVIKQLNSLWEEYIKLQPGQDRRNLFIKMNEIIGANDTDEVGKWFDEHSQIHDKSENDLADEHVINAARELANAKEAEAKAVDKTTEEVQEETEAVAEETNALEKLNELWKEYNKLHGNTSKEAVQKRADLRSSIAQLMIDNGIDEKQLKPWQQKEIQSSLRIKRMLINGATPIPQSQVESIFGKETAQAAVADGMIKQAEESTEAIKEEGKAAEEAGEKIKKAAEKKKEFSKASKEVAQTTTVSTEVIKDEANAADNLNIIIGNNGSAEDFIKDIDNGDWLERIRHDVLNQANNPFKFMARLDTEQLLSDFESVADNYAEQFNNLFNPETSLEGKDMMSAFRTIYRQIVAERKATLAEQTALEKQTLSERLALVKEEQHGQQAVEKENRQYEEAQRKERLAMLQAEAKDRIELERATEKQIEAETIANRKAMLEAEAQDRKQNKYYEDTQAQERKGILSGEEKDRTAQQKQENKELNAQIKEMVNNINKLKTISNDLFKGDSTATKRFINTLDTINKLYENITANASGKIKDNADLAQEQSFNKVRQEILNSKSYNNLSSDLQKQFSKIFGANMLNDTKKAENEIDKFNSKLIETKNITSEKKVSFIDRLTQAAKSGIGRITTYYLSMMHLTRYAREAVQAVTELDSALTELRVVSNASDYSLRQVSKQAFQLGQRLGSTTAEVVKSITDWRRLGESVENSLTLAEQAARLSVGGLMEVSAATESLVSAMKAYGYAVEDVSQIVDKFIYIGNNYSITSEDLATSLEKSSGALVAAGNSLEEAVALEVAGNTVIQDANSVSNALKAVSMRLRGTTGSALEEIGEDTEGLVENASKLYEIVKRLTTTASNPEGVEIINKANNSYKSTYQILLEISKVWNEIGDVQQAELLEKLAGKVRGSAVAAILSQGDILESAYYDAMNNAEGAGELAVENSLNSIEKKLQQFRNEVKNLMTDVIESDTIKGFIDFGTQVVAVLDQIIPKVSLLGTALGTLVGGSVYRPIADSMINAGSDGLLKGFSKIDKYKEQFHFDTFTEDELSIIDSYIKKVEKAGSTNETLQKSLTQCRKDASDFAIAVSSDTSTLQAYTLKSKLATVATNALKSALAALVSIGVGLAISAVTSAISNFIQKQKELISNANETHEQFKRQVKDIEDYTKKIKELKDQLEDENTTQAEAYNIRAKLVEAQDDLISKYDIEADKLDLLNDKYETINKNIKETLKNIAYENVQNTESAYKRAKKNLDKKEVYDLYNPILSYDYELAAIDDEGLNNLIKDYTGDESSVERVSLLSKVGNAEETLRNFDRALNEYANKYPKYIEMLRSSIRKTLEQFDNDEDYKNAISNITEYENSLLQTTNEYYDAKEAITKYNQAIITGSEEELRSAIDNLDNVKHAIISKDFYEGLSKEESDIAWKAFTRLFNFDYGQAYKELIIKSINNADNKEIQKVMAEFLSLNGGEWSKTIDQIRDNKFSKIQSLLGSFFTFSNVPYTQDNVNAFADAFIDFATKAGEAAQNKVEPLSLNDWFQTPSSIKQDDKKNYNNNALVEAYKKSISQFTQYVQDEKEGKVKVNWNDMIEVVSNDELFKSLGLDGFDKYLKEYGQDGLKATYAFVKDAFLALFDNFDLDNLSIDGMESLVKILESFQIEALGGSTSVEELENSLVDLNKILNKIKNGESFSYEEMHRIVTSFKDLKDNVINNDDGTYSFHKEAVESLINSYGSLSNEAIATLNELSSDYGEFGDYIIGVYKDIRLAAIDAALANYNLVESVDKIIQVYKDAKNDRNGGGTNKLKNEHRFGQYTDEVLNLLAEREQIEGLDTSNYSYSTTTPYHNTYKTSGSGSTGKYRGENEIDWIANSLDNLANEVDKVQGVYDRMLTTFGNDKDLVKANEQLDTINDTLTEQINGFERAAKAYKQEYLNIGLTDEQMKLVENTATTGVRGWTIDYYDKSDEEKELYDRLNYALKYYQKYQENLEKAEDTRHKKEQNNIQKLQNEYDNLGAKIAKVEAQMNPETSVKKQQKLVTKLIDLYTEQYNKEIDIAKAKGETIKAAELEATQEQKINELIAQRSQLSIDAITTRYDRILSEYDNRQRILEHGIAMTEGKGQIVSTKYYKGLIDNERRGMKKLYAEREKLVKELNSIDTTSNEGLNQWWETKNKIDDVTAALYESEEAVLEWNNAIRQVKWDVFDRVLNTIKGISTEAEYLRNLFANDDPFEYVKEIWEYNGSQQKVYYGEWSEEGLAMLGLYETELKTNSELAAKAAKEIDRLNEEIANSEEYDLNLIDRRDTLIEQQREYTNSVEETKQAIISLVKEGYDKQLESLSELSSRYMDALRSEKELYSYQKGISKKTKDIVNLRKMIASLQGDSSQEAIGKLQQYEFQLKEAEEDLTNTQQEHYFDEQQKLLDRMINEYETYLNNKIDDRTALLKEMETKVDKNQKTIKETVEKKTQELGTTVSDTMNAVLNTQITKLISIENAINTNDIDLKAIRESVKSTDDFLQNFKDNYDIEKFKTNTAGIEEKIDSVNTNLGQILNAMKNPGNAGENKTTNKTKSNNKTTSNVPTQSGTFHGVLAEDFEGGINHGITKIVAEAAYNAMSEYGTSFTQAFGKFTGSKKQYEEMYWWLKDNGYATGARRIKKDEFAWTQENGLEAIIRQSDGAILTPLARNDAVLDATATQNLWDMANNPLQFIKENSTIPNLPTKIYGGDYDIQQSMVVTLPNVKNYNEFVTELQRDKKFERMIQDMTIGQLTGNNSLSKFKYKY